MTAQNISPKHIALELTERHTADQTVLAQMLDPFRRSGFQILIDDFGTGYSSLSYLERLPVSGIKIDRMFVQALGHGSIGTMVVKQIIDLATALDICLICEGIETQEQADILMGQSRNLAAQGWLFGKPVSAEEFSRVFPEKVA
eukprot:TRINITY_DN5238_c0_g1_i1.p1 TRINITY_DN5238_c0_g1~~TRINITY_DN5238_c0_g1_i1.p1  ORF type:complete len:152 (-),score=26.72 TRINITY_DN5238_c0_g1_i1:310-741(-)